MKQSRLPSPYYGQQSGSGSANVAVTNIPTPVSQRFSRTPAPGVNSLKCSSSTTSSRSASPSSYSFIPTPKSALNAKSLHEKQLISGSGTRIGGKIVATNGNLFGAPPPAKSFMTEKVKSLNGKERNKSSAIITSSNLSINSAKRTSSSSGVSSTRSERSSDSSNSLCNVDVRPSFCEPKESVSFSMDAKSSVKKKVIVKPTETRAIKLPTKSTSYRQAEEKNQNSIQDPTQQSSNKEDGKTIMSESSRLSGSGIPKPTAAVKGTAKPTNSVAPMLIVKQQRQQASESEEKPIVNVDPIVLEKGHLKEVGKNDGNHSKQSSLGEEDELSMLNIKPMEPLLRGYKRNVNFPRRITSASTTFTAGGQARSMNGHSHHYMMQYDAMKKGTEKNDCEITSGYVSDGDVLQVNSLMNGKCYNEVDGGYLSEGGVQFYERYSSNLDLKLNSKTNKRNDSSAKSDNLSSIPGSPNLNRILTDRSHQSTDVLTALSTGSPLHKFGNKLNGRGLGPDEGLVSPPEPTPTHAGSYTTSYRIPSPHISPLEQTPVVYRVVGARTQVKKSDSGQQTENSSFKQTLNTHDGHWRKFTESNTLVGSDHLRVRNEPSCSENVRIREKRSPSTGSTNLSNTGSLLRNRSDKKRISSTTSSREELADVEYYDGERKSRADGKGKAKGVPSSFGYVKRSTSNSSKESRTAQVSAVPRTKVKVSGGTQTDMKSYSLSSAAANQLSQSVRERILMGTSDVMSKSPSRSQSNHHKTTGRDSLPGSLSDSNYTDLHVMSNQNGTWFRHGSPYTASLPTRSNAGSGLLDAESIESLPAQLQHRASLTSTRLLTGSASPALNNSSRLSRSNSIRSTKSEKMYPSMLQRSDELEPLYNIPYSLTGGPVNCNSSQDEPPSPTPSHLSSQGTSAGNSSRYHYAASPSSSGQSYSRNSPYMNYLTKMNSKEDDMHGSAMSLVSTASSSLYSAPEDKQAQEMRRLRRDLSEAQQKVHTLTSQISTNAHVVSAFEKSLSSMTQRIQQLTANNEKKESELSEARQTIEMLQKQTGESVTRDGTPVHNNCSPSLTRRHTINTTIESTSNNISRQLSTDSVSSLVSLSSVCSLSSGNQHGESNAVDKNGKKKRGWLRSSFSKAFSRSKKNRNGSVSDIEDSRTTQSDLSAPSSPLLNSPHGLNGNILDECKSYLVSNMKSSHSSSALYDEHNDRLLSDVECSPEVVIELKKQLREKDLVLTDIRLEALSSAHQLESLKDTVMKMRNDMLALKQDNERLQRIVTSKSLASSQTSLQTHDSLDRRYSTTDVPTERADIDFLMAEKHDTDAKRVAVCVFCGSHGSYHKYVDAAHNDNNECPIALIPVSTKTNWETLDGLVWKAFREYLDRIDPGSNLGLDRDSIWSYHVGEIVRYKDSKEPELLPCGYLVGGAASLITVCLKGALYNGSLDALAFEMLVPISVVQRYLMLLSEHRRIMLYGPSGTGKTSLAHKIGEYLLYRDGKEVTSNAIMTFNVDEKSTKDLRQYLSNLAEQCDSGNNNGETHELPYVIILDNLHLAASLSDVLNALVNIKSLFKVCPYVIGTLNQQPSSSSSNLQLHHNFRWILCANHLDPVKGFLSRYLRRRLIEVECKKGSRNPELWRIIDWIPKVQLHLNQFLETHASSDVTIGPKLFMSCPMEVDGSQVWFTDLWNYSLVPYLLDAVRDGLQTYTKRAPWEDPTQFIFRTYPWSKSASVHGGMESLMRLRPEDVGYEMKPESDPLMNMLITLQEAANYSSSTHSNESDTMASNALTVGCATNSTI